MCDFSCYGGTSDDWLALQSGLLPSVSQKTQPVEERKKQVNEARESLAAEGMKALQSQVRLQDYAVPVRDGSTIEARSYQSLETEGEKPLPIYMHFHGGGFLFGTLASEDAICSKIAVNVGIIVINVNYRHTPEYRYPTAWNDAEDTFEWLHDNISTLGGDPHQVVLGGISAGAWLTASLTLEKSLGRILGSYPAIAGQVLMIPCVVHMDCYGPQLQKLKSPSISSLEENKYAPLLPVSACQFFTELLKVDSPDEADTRLNPGNASFTDVKGLPPTVFGIAGLDPLRDEGLLYAKMLTETG
jgi:acetyl esterase/lipase